MAQHRYLRQSSSLDQSDRPRTIQQGARQTISCMDGGCCQSIDIKREMTLTRNRRFELPQHQNN